ncbi:MAG: HAD family phosphatase [archaeon]|jgi:HAD superfamily hydrolase (TIGR01509 family)
MKTTVLFDMDGVISDTQDMQAEIESQLLKRFGINIPSKEITRRYAGVRTSEFFKDLLDKKKVVYDIDKLMEEKRKKVITNIKKELKEIPGSVELIKKLYKDGYKLAVASATNRLQVETNLKKLKVRKYFSVVVTGDDVKHGKPNPESYLLAAKKLHSKSSECIVIEDGINGMQAGKNAKMFVIGLVPKGSKLKYPADLLVNTHKETMKLDLRKL